MRIAIDLGHSLNGSGSGDTGAGGYLIETVVNRQYGALVIAGLQKLGHTVINVTPAQSELTLGQSLAYRVNKANNSKVDLFVSLHVNAFQTDKASGCEVEYISAKAKVYADRINTQMATLGFHNRGSVSRPGLYVLKHTNATAILVEPFFCDTKSDCNKYNAEKLANAIVKGITGKDIPNITIKPATVSKPTVTTGNKTYRVITGSFADEANADARIKELEAKGFKSFKILI
ncbi:MAG TPA: N-acetylmuramoyl-L-alanine amidase [Clostridiaceae bacterium]